MSKDNTLPKSSAALETAILNILPKYEHSAIPVDAILYRLHIRVTKASRANLYSRVSNGAKSLVDGELCNRSKSFNIYHYWKTEAALNKKDPSLLSTKAKEELIRVKAYIFAPSAESAFLDLLYLYKSNQKVKGNEFIKDFTNWFKESISLRHKLSITRGTLIAMMKTLQFQIKISQGNKGIGKGVWEKVEGVGHLNPSKSASYYRNIVFQAIPLEENQAITARQLSTSLVIPRAQSTVSVDLTALWHEKRVNRNWTGNAFRYWRKAAGDDEKAQTLGKKHPPGYPSVTYPLVQMDSSSPQDILTRIKTVEDDITQIHERYAKIEGIIEEKELRGKLQKLEESKDKEQQKLDLLEEKLRKWNTDDLKCKSGILK